MRIDLISKQMAIRPCCNLYRSICMLMYLKNELYNQYYYSHRCLICRYYSAPKQYIYISFELIIPIKDRLPLTYPVLSTSFKNSTKPRAHKLPRFGRHSACILCAQNNSECGRRTRGNIECACVPNRCLSSFGSKRFSSLNK